MSSNLCGRRRRLYQTQLDDTRTYLGNLVAPKGVLASNAGQLGTALADPTLIDALEQILNAYVTCAVARDLQRLAASKALFVSDPDDRPPLAEVLAKPDTVVEGRLDTDNGANKRRAYNRYFDWYIDPANVAADGEKAKSGVAAFYERYPLIDHAVKTVTEHYQQNIKLACQRVVENWTEINVAFFGSKMTELKKIRTTGNDFHKGGRQVLILSFQLAGPVAGGDGAPELGRVVYKPSGVEIDCRIVGDSATVNKVRPQLYAQKSSLTEIINKYLPPGQARDGFTTRALPTYGVLPYNRDSVPDSYGYIEFLTHGPELDVPIVSRDKIPEAVGEKVRTLDRGTIAASDWITPNPTDAQVFYHQFGALMAMAMAVSLCDLHLQNVIAHDRRPHLIDLEEALKRPMTNVGQTYLNGALGVYHDPEAPALSVEGDRTSDLKVEGWKSPADSPAACVLYLFRGASAPAEPATLDEPRNRRALIHGLSDVFGTLASEQCFGDVKAWAEGLGATIARYVPRATKLYADSCRALYRFNCEAAVKSPPPDSWYDQVRSATDATFFFREQISGRRKGFRDQVNVLNQGWKEDRWIAPFFAAEHPDHAWRDFLNCDVPSFYHLLGDRDLRNSAGRTVNVKTSVEWQEKNMNGLEKTPDGWSADPQGHYLPQAPIEMVATQLGWLKSVWGLPQQFRQNKARDTFLRQALAGTGLIGEIKRLPVNPTLQRRAVVSGSKS